jgi:hypothetical protein
VCHSLRLTPKQIPHLPPVHRCVYITQLRGWDGTNERLVREVGAERVCVREYQPANRMCTHIDKRAVDGVPSSVVPLQSLLLAVEIKRVGLKALLCQIHLSRTQSVLVALRCKEGEGRRSRALIREQDGSKWLYSTVLWRGPVCGRQTGGIQENVAEPSSLPRTEILRRRHIARGGGLNHQARDHLRRG